MATSSLRNGRVSARLALVEEHIRLENAHDLEGVLQTFGAGTPTEAANYQFSISVTGHGGHTSTVAYTLAVATAPA